ncbi:uncharacterized protein LOC133200201 [Saccostrea echinata]|uniref:uncharacterized protein LOC133200201 n=1 Tax=Saccostrea echinata TaxID=191078 RepID=UPI002A7FE006|nr:uncharacterized protein LOC133200201 [Saccostrea echinata]
MCDNGDDTPDFKNGKEFLAYIKGNLREEIHFSPKRGDALRAKFRHAQKIGKIQEDEEWKIAQDDWRWGILDICSNKSIQSTGTLHIRSAGRIDGGIKKIKKKGGKEKRKKISAGKKNKGKKEKVMKKQKIFEGEEGYKEDKQIPELGGRTMRMRQFFTCLCCC